MDANAGKDVYDLLEKLIHTSEDIKSSNGEVHIAPQTDFSTEQNPQDSPNTIRIMDNGFVNLSRILSEQKALINQLQDKVQEFSTVVETEASKQEDKAVTLAELQAQLDKNNQHMLTQWQLKIKAVEDNLQHKIEQAATTQQMNLTSQDHTPKWLLRLGIALLVLNTLLLLWNLYFLSKQNQLADKNAAHSTQVIEQPLDPSTASIPIVNDNILEEEDTESASTEEALIQNPGNEESQAPNTVKQSNTNTVVSTNQNKTSNSATLTEQASKKVTEEVKKTAPTEINNTTNSPIPKENAAPKKTTRDTTNSKKEVFFGDD
ncbi:MAG: hypothetical protein R2831_02240 [Chitinophagaceae bacterium]